MGFRSGFVSIVGAPNVGKSTLLNSILGTKVAITTHKPQTTRQRIAGIKHLDGAQIVYMDTPGIHKAKKGLNAYMVEEALKSIPDADLIYFLPLILPDMVEGADFELKEVDKEIIERLKKAGKPVFCVLNKKDLFAPDFLAWALERLGKEEVFERVFAVSAKTGEGVPDLVLATAKMLPEGPPYYPEDMITDKDVYFQVAEIIREKVIVATRQEIPYSTAVVVEQMKKREEKDLIDIRATIFVERDSQKGIVIGKGGKKLKEIGQMARKELEVMLGMQVYLELFVKVSKDWTEYEGGLRRLGYE